MPDEVVAGSLSLLLARVSMTSSSTSMMNLRLDMAALSMVSKWKGVFQKRSAAVWSVSKNDVSKFETVTRETSSHRRHRV